MPRFVTALFDDPAQIPPAMESLKRIGLMASDIQTVDQKREAEGFFDRLFLDQNGDENHDEITVLGIAKADADTYAERVGRGEVLLIAMCDDELEEEVRDVVRRSGGHEIGEKERLVEEEATSALEEYPTDTPKWFTVVETDDVDPDRDVREHAIHIHTLPDVHHARAVDFPGGHPSVRFEEFETEFRVHYAENFADSKYSFDDFRVAYLFGMALAQNPKLKPHPWTKIKDAARRGWRDHCDKPWSIFEEAVHFGWRKIRGRQRRAARR